MPLTISGVLATLMANSPDDRYPSADALLKDLAAIDKRTCPKHAVRWNDTPVDAPKLNAASINRAGVRKSLQIQRSMQRHGDRLLSLGQLMLANDHVVFGQTPPPRMGADVIAVLALSNEVTNNEATNNEAASVEGADAVTLRALADTVPVTPEPLQEPSASSTSSESHATTEGVDEIRHPTYSHRAAHTPVSLGFDGRTLALEVRAPFADVFAVQHYFDLLINFPFSEPPRAALHLARGTMLTIDDVAWLVEGHNLLLRRGGEFTVVAHGAEAMTFLTGHQLDQYLTVVNAISVHDTPEPVSGAPDAGVVDRARALMEAGDFVRAKHALMPRLAPDAPDDEAVLEIAHEIAMRLVDDGTAAAERGEFDAAKTSFDHAIALAPKSPDGFFHKALVLKKLGQLSYALRYFGEAIALDPDDPALYYNRAIVRARLEDVAGAIDDLTACVERHPQHANAYYNRGIAFEKLGDAVHARQDFVIAMRLNPRFARVLGARLKAADPDSP